MMAWGRFRLSDLTVPNNIHGQYAKKGMLPTSMRGTQGLRVWMPITPAIPLEDVRRATASVQRKGASNMRRWRIVAGFTALLIVGFGPGCEGFFVDPLLTGLTVGPAATIQTGTTLQMSAVGTYDDGSQKDLKSGVYWNSGTPSVASVSASGLVNGLNPGKTVITGASGTVTASATVTVTIGGLTSIQVTTADGLTSIAYGSSEQFVATGTANGQKIDITDSVDWSTNPKSIEGVSIASNTGLLITASASTTPVTFAVVALDPSTGISGQINFTVHP
jgi:hypothetical protein